MDSLSLLFLKTIEKVIRLCTVEKKNFSGGCEGRLILWPFFTIFSRETIYLSPKLREKLPIKYFFFKTVHTLITFSIVFTNKNTS